MCNCMFVRLISTDLESLLVGGQKCPSGNIQINFQYFVCFINRADLNHSLMLVFATPLYNNGKSKYYKDT